MSVKLKLCGFQKLEDINFAFSQGVDYIGLNNIVISKRFLNSDEIINLIKEIQVEYRAKLVILLNHLDIGFLKSLKELGIKVIQSYLLENDEKQLLAMNFEVIKVFAISQKADLEEIKKFDFEKYSYCLLDAKVDGLIGGTGKTFDWKLFCELDILLKVDLILAGGLNTLNIQSALAETRASFVDLAGGVEEKTGEKSYALIKELTAALKG